MGVNFGFFSENVLEMFLETLTSLHRVFTRARVHRCSTSRGRANCRACTTSRGVATSFRWPTGRCSRKCWPSEYEERRKESELSLNNCHVLKLLNLTLRFSDVAVKLVFYCLFSVFFACFELSFCLLLSNKSFM